MTPEGTIAEPAEDVGWDNSRRPWQLTEKADCLPQSETQRPAWTRAGF